MNAKVKQFAAIVEAHLLSGVNFWMWVLWAGVNEVSFFKQVGVLCKKCPGQLFSERYIPSNQPFFKNFVRILY